MMRELLRLVMAPVFACRFYFGGDSSSSSDQITTMTDARVTGGYGGAQISGSGNSVTVVSSDYGAIMGGVEAARGALAANTAATTAAIKSATDTSTRFAGAAQAVFGQALAANQAITDKANSSIAQAYEGALASVDRAYETSKAGDQRIVAMVGLAVVGLAAVVVIFGKR